MKKRTVYILVICLLFAAFITAIVVIEKYKPAEVNINTSKAEYSPNETVKISITSNKAVYADQEYPLIIEKYVNDSWNMIYPDYGPLCECYNGKLACMLLERSQPIYEEVRHPSEIEWDQTKCVYETRICGNETYKECVRTQVDSSKFKAKFCYWHEKYGEGDYKEFVPEDKRKCVEKEFSII